MEEQYKKGFEDASKVIAFIFNLMLATGGLLYNLLLIFGAFASLFLVFKLFPVDFAKGLVLFYPIWNAVWNILFFLFYILLGSLFGYIIIRFGFWYVDLIKRSKERVRIKRKERLDELVDEITKKLKRKKK
jgi:hypothetical protein